MQTKTINCRTNQQPSERAAKPSERPIALVHAQSNQLLGLISSIEDQMYIAYYTKLEFLA